ncbi:ArgR family transcriptional regulator [[Pantoea] beijingensis]|uniref:Arginine repressor n=1 Tax=[Pantoea] beijingensis TaxID=1324864 RepID=A0A443IBJ3_9GAMM|nr:MULTISPECIES: ArgR family transcriptional regulator [Erwiniaceae]RWR01469.1 ArgR family transcriptional regulator [[Pantoea] beijingensis]
MAKKCSKAREKESQQLLLCRRLIANNHYHSQQNLRQDLQKYGYHNISQSTVSRLLTTLDVIKTTNVRGEKIYALNPQQQAKPDVLRPVSDMILSVDYNAKFVIIEVIAGYARPVARIVESHNLSGVLGVVASNNHVWISPRNTNNTYLLYRRISYLLGQALKDDSGQPHKETRAS